MTTSTTDTLQMATISTATYPNFDMTIYDEYFTNWFDNFMADFEYLPSDVTPDQKERLYQAILRGNANMIEEISAEIAFNASKVYEQDEEDEQDEQDEEEEEEEEKYYLYGKVKADFMYMLYTTPFTEKDLDQMVTLIEERRKFIKHH